MAGGAQVSEANVQALVKLQAHADVAEANVQALVKIRADAKVSETYTQAVVKLQAGAQVAEANIQALVYRSCPASERCDLWKITRTDGVVFGFTSFDSDIEAFGITFKSCASLQDSASESSADSGSTGSVELTGLISDDAITDADLYSGVFDDAYVECWVISWGSGNDAQAPFRVGAGWMGTITRGQDSYVAEVLGPKARLQQNALVDFYQPGCRWQFGDSNCTVNKTALQVENVECTGSATRFIIYFPNQAVPTQTALWNGGYIVWTSGQNAGQSCQTETVDWEAGVMSLWDPAPFVPAPGDTFTVVPGCSYDTDGCNVYGNFINFGGFPNVPGPDALQQNASALFASS